MNRIAASLALAFIAATVPLSAQAQSPSTQRVEVVGAASAPTFEARGQYALEDGRTLELSMRGRELRADLDGRATTVLRAAGPAQYASADGRMRVQLKVHDNGNVSGLVLTEWRGREVVRTASR